MLDGNIPLMFLESLNEADRSLVLQEVFPVRLPFLPSFEVFLLLGIFLLSLAKDSSDDASPPFRSSIDRSLKLRDDLKAVLAFIVFWLPWIRLVSELEPMPFSDVRLSVSRRRLERLEFTLLSIKTLLFAAISAIFFVFEKMGTSTTSCCVLSAELFPSFLAPMTGLGNAEFRVNTSGVSPILCFGLKGTLGWNIR